MVLEANGARSQLLFHMPVMWMPSPHFSVMRACCFANNHIQFTQYDFKILRQQCFLAFSSSNLHVAMYGELHVVYALVSKITHSIWFLSKYKTDHVMLRVLTNIG